MVEMLAAKQQSKKKWASLSLAILKRFRNLGLLAGLLALWQYGSTMVLSEQTAILLPPPTAIAEAAYELITSGELWRNLLASLRREFVAFLFALLAIPLGIAMGWWREFNNQVNPVIEILRPIPPLAWIPLSILWFGIGEKQNDFIIFLGIFFPVLLNTIAGVRGVDLNLVRAARCLGASKINVLTRIVLKAALPSIVTGIRIGLGVGWMALVAAELVGASSGLGFMINDARTLLRTDYVMVGMLTIGLAGLSIDWAVSMLGYRLLPWSGAMRRES